MALWKRGNWYWADFTVNGSRYRIPLRFRANPDCKAPYFFARRRSQKYCRDLCALPSQKEFKRRWCAEHGEARRKARKASEKKSQRKRGK